jgi:ABC-type sugar transport system substrate-binding protein
MLKSIKITALSAFLGLGALAAGPATAQASGLHIGISTHNLSVGYGHGWNRACTPGRAVAKAQRLGVRHARVRNVGPRTIRVAGVRYGHRVNVTFSKARNCPVLRW